MAIKKPVQFFSLVVCALLLSFFLISGTAVAVNEVNIRATANVPATDLMAGTMEHFLITAKPTMPSTSTMCM